MALFVLSVSLALLISAKCSLMEATLLSITPSQVADLAQREPKIGKIWQRFKANIQPPIAAILMLNTAAHTIGASVAGSQFDELYGDKWILAFSLVLTFVMLQFTEILPKTIGVRYNREVASFVARPLSAVVVALAPLIHLIHWINRPFEGRKAKTEHPATIEEIAALAGLARLSNQITPYQERIIRGASRLSELPIEEIMIPVDQVSFLSSTQSIADAVIAAHVEAHTRFPIIDADDRDQVIGYVNFKEVIYYMRTNPNEQSFRGIVRPVRFVAPETSAADLLKSFVHDQVRIAIVRSQDGKTLGMVTFEDIVEELVGDLTDEFDRLPKMNHPFGEGTWMLGGGIAMSQVGTLLGLELSQHTETLSAWLIQRFGRIPRPGDRLREGEVEFVVRHVRRGQVFEAAANRLVLPDP
jgi:putative hemolysin